MKKVSAILILVALGFSGCETNIEETQMKEMYNGCPVGNFNIDSCEYIYINCDLRSLTHKGNCKYCIERNKK